MKAFVTKYALTSGIIEVDGEVSENHPTMLTVREASGMPYMNHHHGKDWHSTREDALARAEEMRKAKLISLAKQVKKISNLEF